MASFCTLVCSTVLRSWRTFYSPFVCSFCRSENFYGIASQCIAFQDFELDIGRTRLVRFSIFESTTHLSQNDFHEPITLLPLAVPSVHSLPWLPRPLLRPYTTLRFSFLAISQIPIGKNGMYLFRTWCNIYPLQKEFSILETTGGFHVLIQISCRSYFWKTGRDHLFGPCYLCRPSQRNEVYIGSKYLHN